MSADLTPEERTKLTEIKGVLLRYRYHDIHIGQANRLLHQLGIEGSDVFNVLQGKITRRQLRRAANGPSMAELMRKHKVITASGLIRRDGAK